MKISVILFALLLLPNSGVGSSRSGCVNGNCDNGFGEWLYRSGDSYTGFWKDGIRYGRGTYRFEDGGVFIGNYANDRRHGTGKYVTADGDETSGYWAEGRLINPQRSAIPQQQATSVFAPSAATASAQSSTTLPVAPVAPGTIRPSQPQLQSWPTLSPSATTARVGTESLSTSDLPQSKQQQLEQEALQLINACTGYDASTIRELTYLYDAPGENFNELYFRFRAYNAGSYQRLAGVLEFTLKLRKYHDGSYEQGIDSGRYYWGNCV